MNIQKINSFNILSFCAIKKVPTSSGYKIYDDENLVQEVSFDMERKSLTKDVFDKSGNKITSNKTVYPYGTILTTKYEYDSNNNLTRQIIVDDKGEIRQENVFEYNSDGKYKLAKCKDNFLNHIYITTYDENGKKCKTVADKGGTKEVTKYFYNKYGTLERETTYNEENKEIYNVVYTYDANKALIKCSHYDSDDNIAYQEFFDPKTGNLLKTCFRSEDGVMVSDEYFNDAEFNKPMFHTLKEDDEEITLTRYVYDKKGNLVGEITTVEDKVTDAVEYSPRTGKVVARTEFNDGRVTIREEFGYDQYGRANASLLRLSTKLYPRIQLFDYKNGCFMEFDTKQ